MSTAAALEPVPGPSGLPVVGVLWEMRGDPLAFLTDTARRYGDISRSRIGGMTFTQLSHPDLIEELLVRRRDVIGRDVVTRNLDDVLGQGLLTSDGEHWKRQRKRIAPSFQPRHLAAYGDAMVRSTRERLPELGDRDIHADMSAVTLDIVIRTLFGAEPGGEASQVGPLLEGLMQAFETEQRTLWRIVPDWVPGAHRRQVTETTATLDRLMLGLVKRARSDDAERDDLLARLLAARDEDGGAMSDRELRDELVTLFLAGHETTALALSYALYLLAEHPEHQDAARAEVAEATGGDPLTMSDLPKLKFVHAVVQEAMRLYPPAWAIGREALEDFEIGGRVIPKGTQVTCSQWVVHRDPRFWIGPDRFRPIRWLNGETDSLPRFAYFPFGGGPRVCVGNHFAMMEAQLVLGTLLQHRRFTPSPGYVPDLLPAVTLRSRNGVRVRVQE